MKELNLSENIVDPRPDRFLVYSKITQDTADTLDNLTDTQRARDILNECLSPENIVRELALPEDDRIQPRVDLILDLHCMNYKYAQDQGFEGRKIAVFLEIMNYILEESMRQRLSRADSFKLFKERLLRHTVNRPPHSLGIFNLEDIKGICKFSQENFFRHYAMYQYALLTHLNLELGTEEFFEVEAPDSTDIGEEFEIQSKEIPDLLQYFSREELEQKKREDIADAKAKELEAILDGEMGRLQANLNKKLEKQEKRVLEKAGK